MLMAQFPCWLLFKVLHRRKLFKERCMCIKFCEAPRNFLEPSVSRSGIQKDKFEGIAFQYPNFAQRVLISSDRSFNVFYKFRFLRCTSFQTQLLILAIFVLGKALFESGNILWIVAIHANSVFTPFCLKRLTKVDEADILSHSNTLCIVIGQVSQKMFCQQQSKPRKNFSEKLSSKSQELQRSQAVMSICRAQIFIPLAFNGLKLLD